MTAREHGAIAAVGPAGAPRTGRCDPLRAARAAGRATAGTDRMVIAAVDAPAPGVWPSRQRLDTAARHFLYPSVLPLVRRSVVVSIPIAGPAVAGAMTSPKGESRT